MRRLTQLLALASIAFTPSLAQTQQTQPLRRYSSVFQQSLDVANRLATYRLPSTQRVGTLSANPYIPQSTSSLVDQYRYDSPSNPYGPYGGRYSVDGARNPYTTGGLRIIAEDGTYLGRLNGNRYDPESVANPYGRYGSRYSPTSVNNTYGTYGSPYSPYSATNPYATNAPGLYTPNRSYSLGTLTLPSVQLPPLPGLPSLRTPGLRTRTRKPGG